MSKFSEVSCNDCYFRCAALCALPGDNPCPTFRPATKTQLAPPRQPRLVSRPRPPPPPPRAAARGREEIGAGHEGNPRFERTCQQLAGVHALGERDPEEVAALGPAPRH